MKKFLLILLIIVVIFNTFFICISCKKENKEENNIPNEIIPTTVYKYVEGMKNVIEFGEYPQTYIKTISADTLKDEAIYDENTGYYSYNNEKYVIVKSLDSIVALDFDSRVRFSDGTYVKEDTEYVFKVEKIKWKILKEENKIATLISLLALDLSVFQNNYVSIEKDFYTTQDMAFYANNWQESNTRYFLNNIFYNKAFNDDEKIIINTTFVKNKSEEESIYSRGQNNTNDKVYILSESEILGTKFGFMGPSNRLIAPSDYAIVKGALLKINNNQISTAYQLRSPCSNGLTIDSITVDGEINMSSIMNEKLCVVPIVNITL